jgi:hypothetical protein
VIDELFTAADVSATRTSDPSGDSCSAASPTRRIACGSQPAGVWRSTIAFVSMPAGSVP